MYLSDFFDGAFEVEGGPKRIPPARNAIAASPGRRVLSTATADAVISHLRFLRDFASIVESSFFNLINNAKLVYALQY
jgi:hypothetical protein